MMNARKFLPTDAVLLGKLADVAARSFERRWLKWSTTYSAA